MSLTLLDLEPRWIYKRKVFAFRCPCCRELWITCKRAPMSYTVQDDIIEAQQREFPGVYVASRQDAAWNFTDHDFNLITVSPSIDASAAGHWHGWITNGYIVGGIPK